MEEISPNNILEVSHISASYQEGKQRKTVHQHRFFIST